MVSGKRTNRSSRQRLSLETLEGRSLLAAVLLHDMNINPADGQPQNLHRVDNSVYFTAFGGTQVGLNGWKTDGTAIGTVETAHRPVASVDGQLLFFENSQLLVGDSSDGPLTVLASPAAAAFDSENALWNGHYYFRGKPGPSSNGYELWRTDGTPEGTEQVIDIRPDSGESNPQNFVPAGDHLFFLADNGTHGRELWRTDGTQGGTQRVTDFASRPMYEVNNLVAVGNVLYFLADDGIDQQALWKVVGTGAPQKVVGPWVDRGTLTAAGDSLFFSRPAAAVQNPIGSVNNRELWKTDGTPGGTVHVKTIPNTEFNFDSFLEFLAVDNKLYFIAHQDGFGFELWTSDGTTAGTQMVEEMTPGASYSFFGFQRHLTRVGNEVYLIDKAADLWRSDGTPAGTFLVKSLDYLPTTEAFAKHPVALGDKLLFRAYDSSAGLELFVSDGTTAGTHVLKDVRPGTTSSRPGQLFTAGEKLFFNADDYVVDLHSNDTGNSAWATDGTTPTKLPSGITTAAALGNELIYAQSPSISQPTYLWRSDGTPAGTELIHDQLFVKEMEPVGSRVFAGGGFELWVTDGTQAGTYRPRLGVGSPSQLTALDQNVVVFTANDAGGREMWRSDGTEAGTFRIKDINGASSSSLSLSGIATMGKDAYFAANDGIAGTSLWRTNGTEAGTQLVKNVSFPRNFIVHGSTLFFTATGDVNSGEELWMTDGTEAGTLLVKDLTPGVRQSSRPANLTLVGNDLFFTAQLTTGGPAELWKTDGTAEGTIRVSPALWKGIPTKAKAIGNKLVFVAFDDAHGNELWESDGTAEGTRLVRDIFPGPRSSDPADFVELQGVLYFTADDGFHGRELWKIDDVAPQVLVVIDVSPDPRTGAVSTIDVQLSERIDLSTFTLADLTLQRNGVPVALTGSVTIAHLSGNTYRVSGLTSLNSAGGTYTLTVVGDGIRDLAGNDGIGSAADSWVVDTTSIGGAVGFVENTPPVLLAPSASINDNEAIDFAGARLILSVAAQDTLSDHLLITTREPVSTSGGEVFVAGQKVGTFTGGAEGSPLEITFGPLATRTDVQAVLRAAGFVNLSERPSADPRTLSVSVLGSSGTLLTLRTKTINVTPVNDAPVLNTSFISEMPSISEDNRNAGGMTIPGLLKGGKVTDVDGSAQKGIAVVYLGSTGKGKWQYSLNGGMNWTDFGTITLDRVRLLPANLQTRIRFVPNANFHGSVRFFFRAWDLTQGSPGGVLDLSGPGKVGLTTAFSQKAEEVTLRIVPVNDAPVLAGIPTGSGYVRGAPAIRLASSATVADADGGNFDGGRLVVRVAEGHHWSNRLVIGGVFTVVEENGVLNVVRKGIAIGTLNPDGGIGTTRLDISLNANASTGIVQQLVRSIRFRTEGGGPLIPRTIAFRVWDGDGGASDAIQTVVAVQ